jgi:signal transduction histidine kinase
VLSHDIANPLTTIKGVAFVLTKSTPTEDLSAQDLIRRLSFHVTKVENMLKHVREMKALESGKHRLDLKELSFGATMSDIHETFQDRLAAKGVTLHWNKAEAGVTFVAEETSFRTSVLSNLISNAIKFSPRDGRVEVSCRESSGTTRIEIRDYGDGVPPAIRGQLFSSSQATNILGTEGESGTGFGMPIVKFYVDLYGGKINFSTKLRSDAETDHGTIFVILLPTKRGLAQNQNADVRKIPVTVQV